MVEQTRGVAGPMHMFSVSVDDKSKEVTVYQMRSTVDQCVVSRRYSANDDDGENVVEQEKKNSVLTSKILDKMTHGLVPEFLSQVYREKRLHVVPENTDAHSSQFLSSENLISLLHAMYVVFECENITIVSLYHSLHIRELRIVLLTNIIECYENSNTNARTQVRNVGFQGNIVIRDDNSNMIRQSLEDETPSSLLKLHEVQHGRDTGQNASNGG